MRGFHILYKHVTLNPQWIWFEHGSFCIVFASTKEINNGWSGDKLTLLGFLAVLCRSVIGFQGCLAHCELHIVFIVKMYFHVLHYIQQALFNCVRWTGDNKGTFRCPRGWTQVVDSSQHVWTNMSARRGLIWDINVHSIHKGEVFFFSCVHI